MHNRPSSWQEKESFPYTMAVSCSLFIKDIPSWDACVALQHKPAPCQTGAHFVQKNWISCSLSSVGPERVLDALLQLKHWWNGQFLADNNYFEGLTEGLTTAREAKKANDVGILQIGSNLEEQRHSTTGCRVLWDHLNRIAKHIFILSFSLE